MHADKLDGRISAEQYDMLSAEWTVRQNAIRRSPDSHERANTAYLDAGVGIIELAQVADSMILA